MRGALRALDARVRPDFRRAVLCAVLAFVLDGAAHTVGGVHAHALHDRLIAYGCTAAFVVLAVTATRSAAGELTRVSLHRAGPTAATPLRVASLLLGYLIVALCGLDLLAVPVGKLLVGGAVTGVILGIAAQQSLSNLFAGVVLLFARPYVPGEAIRIRSGAFGGSLDGVVTSVGLLYTTLDTTDGVINIPNAGLLAAAVGPRLDGAAAASSAHTQVRSDDDGPTSRTGDIGSADTAQAQPDMADATQQLGTVNALGSDPRGRTSQPNNPPSTTGPDRWSRATVVGRRNRRVGTAAWSNDGYDGNDAGRPSGAAAAMEGGAAGGAEHRQPEQSPSQRG